VKPSTRDLCVKLAETLHLSVAERRLLPGGRAPFSELLAGVRDRLLAHGWFPRPPDDEPIGNGALLELREGDTWVHEQHEIGVGRFGPVQVSRVGSLEEGVRAYLDANGGSPIDGVGID
jgi:hypothetical protein